jgi:hypothetical protein
LWLFPGLGPRLDRAAVALWTMGAEKIFEWHEKNAKSTSSCELRLTLIASLAICLLLM